MGKSARTRWTSNLALGAATTLALRCSLRSVAMAALSFTSVNPSLAGAVDFRQVLGQLIEQRRLERGPQRVDLHAVEDLRRERVDQHVARVGVGQAARAEVEDGLVVELADRRPVRALHVVGEDL